MKTREGTDRKDALKALREERKETVARVRARMVVVNEALRKISTELSQGPRTVPDLARSVGLPTDETLWYLMALKKYGKVAEGAKRRGESYYPYELIKDTGLDEAAGQNEQ
jgi:predicted Rossmann fold nucleotide-binding protein DprA/Smf involved in DNA uptake